MADGENYRTPTVDYSDFRKDPENYVKVRVDIPGLKKKFAGHVAANAEIDLQVEGRKLDLTVKLTDNSSQKFCYSIKQLPDPVLSDPQKTFHKVNRNDELVLYLHKEKPRLWDVQLSAVGLETEGH